MLFVRVSPGNGPPACTAGRYERPASVRSALSHGHTDDYSKPVCLLRHLFTSSSPPFLLRPWVCPDLMLPTGRPSDSASRSAQRQSDEVPGPKLGCELLRGLAPLQEPRDECCADLRNRPVLCSDKGVCSLFTKDGQPSSAVAMRDAETLGFFFLPLHHGAASMPTSGQATNRHKSSNCRLFPGRPFRQKRCVKRTAPAGSRPASCQDAQLTPCESEEISPTGKAATSYDKDLTLSDALFPAQSRRPGQKRAGASRCLPRHTRTREVASGDVGFPQHHEIK
jgi:hypothetical protein